MIYKAKELAKITNSELIGNGEIIIKNIVFDSRLIYSAKQTAFIAITTKKNSGERFINNAIEKGIEIIIAEHPINNDKITQIIVKNSIDFLRTLAKFHIGKFNLKTIGITGSNGKTILKEWIYQSVANDYESIKSPKSFNSQIGLPLSLLQIENNHELGIFEVGISKPDEMQKQAELFSPKIGLLTHIGTAHSANFESEEHLIKEKLKLFKNSNIIIFNGDNNLVNKIIKTLYPSKRLISYGLNKENNIKIISDISNRNENIKVNYFDEIFSFPAQQRDEATLTNALALIAVLKELNFDNQKIVEKINALKSIEMRLESIEAVRNNLLINDSYNLDYDSLIIALQFIKEYNKNKKALVLTDFLDSSKDKNQFYKDISDIVNEQNFNHIFLVGTEISEYKQNFNSETYTFDNISQLIESKIINELENELILLKGARKFSIEKLKEHLELRKHETVLEINLNAILHNINYHKSLLKPETKMMVMVKANAYGLGSYEISEFLQLNHIDYLGVAVADEGAELRRKGITVPIIVMNPEQHSYQTIIEYNLEPEIYSLRVLNLFNEQLVKSGYQGKYPIHLKLETGMHRLGFKDFELNELIKRIKEINVNVASIFSHLSSADDPNEKEFTLKQLKVYDTNSSYLIDNLGYKPIRHILNSAGITNFTDHQYDMVRIGIGMIGESADINVKNQLQKSVVFKTVISQISEINAGESISYNRKYKTDHKTKIAVVPVGYADGIPRLIGNSVGNVSIDNKLCPIVGNICMDMMMINIDATNAKEGDPVYIFKEKPSLEDFANYSKTITYEVLTSISPRVKRIYIKN